MTHSSAFGGVDDGSIVQVRFRHGSIFTKNAGIVSAESVMSTGPALDPDIKRDIIYTRITNGIPIYDSELDERNPDMDFVEKCGEFDAYLKRIEPLGYARNGIGYVSRHGTALSTARDANGEETPLFIHGVSPECVDDVKACRKGRSMGKRHSGDAATMEIGFGAESILTRKLGIVKLSRMLYPAFYDGCKEVSEEDKMKVLGIVMEKGGSGYDIVKEVKEILGPFPRYFWFVRNAQPVCYVGSAVGFGEEKDYGEDGKEFTLSNMYSRGKDVFTNPCISYGISPDCIKSINLLE